MNTRSMYIDDRKLNEWLNFTNNLHDLIYGVGLHQVHTLVISKDGTYAYTDKGIGKVETGKINFSKLLTNPEKIKNTCWDYVEKQFRGHIQFIEQYNIILISIEPINNNVMFIDAASRAKINWNLSYNNLKSKGLTSEHLVFLKKQHPERTIQERNQQIIENNTVKRVRRKKTA